MIKARIEKGKIEVSGHAGYSEKGKDIICAGVSTLAQAAALAIATYDETAQLTAVEGHLLVTFTADDHYIDGVITTLETGLNLIEGQYGEYLKVTCTR